ncbi:GGDEF domain-containing protein [Pseudomonas syringae pv. broussonetiae]|uniref:diguanylate cyclase n=1 Tax=Pseudomonas savastanoi TaxID=29438 RepID=A0A3M5B7V2_PSESS|nr:diguanylate cyclase [Pseudomonas savastanoi]KPW47170.1 GGDEF domain-containing protein [Pseudomonas syringae pv. broussonetiae]KWT15364.1 diguanylate cyclase [Pseudomonas syringae pv. broussonetiae]RMS21456.1 GGDEF domain-containing protein [Pseudomonas savastanoi]RMT26760.1 GGDEF domain-containing protein [Pseudomonas savastanoi]
MLVSALERPDPEDAQLLAEVEQTITSGVGALRFSRVLKQRYQAETRSQRREFLTAVGIGGSLIYNLFLISDWLILRDVFVYVALGRLCLITPMFIVLLVLAQRFSTRWAMETTAATATVLCSLMPMLVMIHSQSPYQIFYQLGMLLIMVYCTMIQQLPLRHAAVAMSCMLIIQLVTTYIANFADFVIWQANAVLFVSTVALLLMASYFLERASRMSYLFALRGRLLQVQLMEFARTDGLTRLFNRRYQDEVMTSVWERARKTPADVAIILLDIDHFKSYNDNYGHPQGDTCLKLLCQKIQQSAHENGAVAFRFGGEEVLVLMNGDAGQAREMADVLQAAVAALKLPHPVLGESAFVTVSLGVACATAPQTNADHLISAADNALYAAKRAGRNCVCFA